MVSMMLASALFIGIMYENVIIHDSISKMIRDLLLHPERLRVVQALVGRPMTAAELKDHLGDVAQATLYRHLNRLEGGGLIAVKGERQVRGVIERTYGIVSEAVSLGPEDMKGATSDDHFRYFGTFVATLLADFASYLEREEPDLEADRVGYRQVPLWLSDEEFDEMVADMGRTVQARLENDPRPDRRRRLLTTIVLPDDRGR